MLDPSTLFAFVPAQYFWAIPLLISLASLADALIPTPAAGSKWVGVRSALHFVALNFANARNAVPAGAVPASVAAHAAEVRTVAAEVETAAGELAQSAKGKAEAIAPVVNIKS